MKTPKIALLVILLTILMGMPLASKAQDLDPLIAAEVQKINFELLGELNSFQKLAQDPERWTDSKFQSLVLVRTARIQADLQEIDAYLLMAIAEEAIPAGLVYGQEETVEAGLGLIDAAVRNASLDATRELGDSLDDMFDSVSRALEALQSDLKEELCSNGIDDDDDGLIDEEDPECPFILE